MRFIVDECAGPTLARWLANKGHDVYSVFDLARGLNDNQILSQAYTETRILITADKGFGEMIFRERRPHCGVILLRLNNERSTVKIAVLKRILEQLGEKVLNHFVVATESHVRIAPRP